MASYNTLFRKVGDGYTYYVKYTPNDGGSTPYGEKTLVEVIAGDESFGGTGTNGAAIAIDREILNDEISQEVAPIQKLVIGESAQLKITIPAGRLENIAMAAGGVASDITDVAAGSMPDSNAAKAMLVGGITTLEFFSLAHQVCNSVSPNLKDYIYAPRCQAAEGFGWSFVAKEVRALELTIDINAAKQDAFAVSLECSSRHALFQVLYEYA